MQLLLKLQKSRERLNECNNKLNDLKVDCIAIQEKVWQFNNRVIVRPTRCADGRPVDAKHEYIEAFINEDRVKELEKSLFWLRETASNECCLDVYESLYTHLQIETFVNEVIQESDQVSKRHNLKNAICSLFAFMRRFYSDDNELMRLALNWLNSLVGSIIFN